MKLIKIHMEIHLSEKFSEIEVINRGNDAITIQCGLWPSWNEIYEIASNSLSSGELAQLETLYRSDSVSRGFEIKNDVLMIRSC